MSYPMHFLISFITTLGFCFFFNVKPRVLISASLAGAFGWIATVLATNLGINVIFANFFAAMIISIFAEIFARIEKAPISIYIIPGILPLVPGFRIYYTIQYLVEGQYQKGVTEGVLAFFIALALAMGIMSITAIFKLIFPTAPKKTLMEYEKEMKS